MAHLAVRSKRVITPEGVKGATIFIHGSIIKEVLPYDVEVDCPVNDVGNKLVMPGVIDTHVHINEPGRTSWEGFNTATKAAIAGGITSLVDMPLNSSPITTTVPALQKKVAKAHQQIHANCGFWGGVIPANIEEIEPLIEQGVLGFKAFLSPSGIKEFPNVTERDLRKVMPILAKHRVPLLVNCELEDDTVLLKKRKPQSYADYLLSRPQKWEDEAIALVIRLCEEFNCKTHIVTLSSANSLERIATAKSQGIPLSAETAQHYLSFNAEDIKDGQTQFKCTPPIRGKENNDQLWEALSTGTIDFVASGHSPAPPEFKRLESGDFVKAWAGITSLQFSLPALWTAAKKRSFNVLDIAKWLCENPAKLAGLENKKGKISSGFDADLVIWDEKKVFKVREAMIHHKHKTTPYFLKELSGLVEQTYIGGTKTYDSGTFMRLNEGKIILMNGSI
ncbi:allantoinase AllB [Desertivirga brevis]|uniref:allantoinase AllB n=1 Tax=Desertivirga brevis TaxID=2810310 RepID=UPI001A95AEE6|nr:allantoinase AllB [Pedobacter sp. SYSU D00873]